MTALLYALGVIHSWWAITLSFIASFVVVMFVQVSLVGAVILTRSVSATLKLKTGLTLRTPFLAPFAWTYYLTKEERNEALADVKETSTPK